MNRIHGGDHIDGGIVPEEAPEFTSSPGAPLPEFENALYDMGRRCVRTGVGSSRAVVQTAESALLNSLQPLVAGGPANPVTATEF
jgi:hypothetical protein